MINFTNIYPTSGMSTNYNIISTAWVDFNKDKLPDLWISPHGYYVNGNQGRLYINKGDGTFSNIYSQVWPSNLPGIPGNDTHGTSWTDYDNDGDRDLFIMTGGHGGGGSEPRLFLVNNNGNLVESASSLGVNYALARGRSTLWFDWNLDGKLDLLQVNQIRSDIQAPAPTSLFQQTHDGTFFKAIELPDSGNANWGAQIADLGGDGTNDVLVMDYLGYKVYKNQPSSLVNITNQFPKTDSLVNAAIADFDGDLVADVFFTRTNNTNLYSTTFQTDTNLAYTRFKVNSSEQSINFQTSGNVTFDFLKTTSLIPTTQIFIGSSGYNPSKYKFTLSSAEGSAALGIKDRDSLSTPGLYIGYNTTTQKWEAFAYQGPATTTPLEIQMMVDSTQAVSGLTSSFTPPDVNQLGKKPFFMTYNKATGKYVDKTAAAGFNQDTFGKNPVQGDFDNDMDVDLFFSNGSSSSLPNILYENQGDGTFIQVANAGNANVTGPFLSYQEPILESFIGNSNVTTADYDLDGFLDIFVSGSSLNTTGGNRYAGTPSQLYHNSSNGNHWLEIDLEGVLSNRDAIGSKVYVTAGGVTQLREQSGGMHGFSQDSQRLHFGLANNTVVDEIEIRWTSGVIEKIDNVAVDQLLHVVESTEFRGTNGDDFLDGAAGNDTILGLAGNDTINGLDGDDSLDGGVGSDSLTGGNGNDIYIVDNIADIIKEEVNSGIDLVNSSVSYTLANNVENLTLTGTTSINGDGNTLDNIITGNNADNIITGKEGNDFLSAAQGNDGLFGNEGNDSLEGAAGNDSLDGGSGNDSMIGGSGNDIYTVDSIGDVITEDASPDIDTINSSINYSLTDNLEKLTLTGTNAINGDGNLVDNLVIGNNADNTITGKEGNDSLNGLEGNDSLLGNEGKDSLTGAEGNDSLDGGLGNDFMIGGNGDDSYWVDNIADKITETANAGIDTINSVITYSLTNNQENLVLLGTDTINGNGNSVDNQITGNSAKNILSGKQGNDNLNGQDGSDNLFGDEGNDYLDGQEGNDTLTGSDGNDTLIGGSGNDNLVALGGIDLIMGGSGSDRFFYNSNTAFTTASVGLHTLSDFTSNIDKIVLDKTTFTNITSANAQGFSVASEFAIVSSDLDAATSQALIVYNSSSGHLFYNSDKELDGYGIGGQIGTLSNSPNIVAKDFVIQA